MIKSITYDRSLMSFAIIWISIELRSEHIFVPIDYLGRNSGYNFLFQLSIKAANPYSSHHIVNLPITCKASFGHDESGLCDFDRFRFFIHFAFFDIH